VHRLHQSDLFEMAAAADVVELALEVLDGL